MNRFIRISLSDISVPAELHDRLAELIMAGLTGSDERLSEAELQEAIYFHAYTDSGVRRRVGYHHALDTFR